MFGLNSRLAPVLCLAIIFGGFMAADKLWLHWYTPDAARTTVERSADPTPVPAIQQPTTAGRSADSVTVPAGSAQTSAAPGNTPAPSLVSRDALAALWAASQQATYRVRYETSSTSGDKGDSYVVFNRPPFARVDTIPAGTSEPSSQIIVGRDGSTIACTFNDGNRRCSQIAPFDGPLPLAAGPIVFPTAASFASLLVAELDSKTIAGTTARCFRTLAADLETADYCFTAETVPVYGRGPFGVVEASELAPPSDADFAVPTP